jgi:hypothetical protein
MRTLWVALLVLAGAGMAFAGGYNNFTIWNTRPFLRGVYGEYAQSTGQFFWDGFDPNRRVWDLSADTANWPGQARVPIYLKRRTDGRPSAPDSFPNAQLVELDTLSGVEVWVYERRDTFATWSMGFDQEQSGFRFLMVYQPSPGVDMYRFPMRPGDSWQRIVNATYDLGGLPYSLTEGHRKRIVGRGKAKVPFSGNKFWPCVILRDHYTFTDNFGTNEDRFIYEWDTPGRFCGGNGVAAVMGVNGADSSFAVVDKMFLQRRIQAADTVTGRPWNFYLPDFTNTTVWPDTQFSGPFIVASTITDSATYSGGVARDSLFYNKRPGDPDTLYHGVGPDSVRGDRYYFTIPSIAQACTIRYFLWATDSFSVANGINIWNTDPIAAPESITYRFVARPGSGVEAGPSQLIPSEYSLSLHPNPMRERTEVRFQVPRRAWVSVWVYNSLGQRIRKLAEGEFSPGSERVAWDGRNGEGHAVPNGVYFCRFEARKGGEPAFNTTRRLTILR